MKVLGRVMSVDKALLIIKLLAEKGKDMKLTEISEELYINISTLHGLISTLKFHGLVDQDAKTQKYRLGLYLIQLGEIAWQSLDIIKITSPIIEKVSNELQETVHVAKLDNTSVVYIDKKESNQSMRIFSSIGLRNPSHSTGVGKAMLAYLDDKELNEILPDKFESFTPKTITDKQEFISGLNLIRENGYAIDDEEFSIGLKCVAAPIFNHDGKAVYSISVSGPSVRMTDEKMQKSIVLIKKAAKEISSKIGYIE